MKIEIDRGDYRSNYKPVGYRLALDRQETCAWATKPGAVWPGSQLRDQGLRVAVDANGVVDCDPAVDDATELEACVTDHLPLDLWHLWPTWGRPFYWSELVDEYVIKTEKDRVRRNTNDDYDLGPRFLFCAGGYRPLPPGQTVHPADSYTHCWVVPTQRVRDSVEPVMVDRLEALRLVRGHDGLIRAEAGASIGRRIVGTVDRASIPADVRWML